MLWRTVRDGSQLVLSSDEPVQIYQLVTRAKSRWSLQGVGTRRVVVTFDRPVRVLIDCPADVRVSVTPLPAARGAA